jgi:hypothetical protein
MDIKETIAAALRKLGPSSPLQISEHLKLDGAKVRHQLRAMLDAKTLKAAGKARGRIYGLPDQDLGKTDTGPAKKSGKAKGGKKRKAARRKTPQRKTRTVRKSRAPKPEPFLASITGDHRLVLNGRAAKPEIFTPEQTSHIATLILHNFEA